MYLEIKDDPGMNEEAKNKKREFSADDDEEEEMNPLTYVAQSLSRGLKSFFSCWVFASLFSSLSLFSLFLVSSVP